MEVSQPRSIVSPRGEPILLAVACALPTLVTLAYFVWARGTASGTQQLIFLVVKVAQFSLPVVWVGWFCRERLGLPRWTNRGIGWGLAFGVAVGLAMGGLYWLLAETPLMATATEAIQQKIVELGLDRAWKFAALGTFYALLHSLLEEYYWRWFVFRRMRAHLSLGMAIGLSSLAFAAHHVVVLWHYFSHAPWAAAFFSLSVAVGGVFWAWLYEKVGSLFPCWISHLVVDAAIFLVGGAIAWPLWATSAG